MITINGRQYEGNNLELKNGKVFIDGKPIDEAQAAAKDGILTLKIEGSPVKVKATGDVHCGNVVGDVQANGDVRCGTVGGHVSANGDVTCGSIGGKVSAGGDVLGRRMW